jgi:uncharacterized protein YndB with AHSA1/START domain
MRAIHHLVRIVAPPAKVFAALTNSKAVEAWFTDTRCERWEAGAKVAWFGGETTMTIEEFQPDAKLVLKVHGGSGWDGTRIAFEVAKLDASRTLVRFDHAGWPEVSDHFRDCSMSWSYFLESLRLYLETGKGTPESTAPACEAGHG